MKFVTIDNLYEFLINIFNQKKVIIKQLIVNDVVALLLKEKKEEGFEIILKNNKKEYKVQNKNKDEANNIKY